ncbi:MAG: hypothetical protein CMI27_02700 [Opitutae bacterium]|nr:hypothetical protein [Opitutae bacterium]
MSQGCGEFLDHRFSGGKQHGIAYPGGGPVLVSAEDAPTVTDSDGDIARRGWRACVAPRVDLDVAMK